jgi:hypothetical protein
MDDPTRTLRLVLEQERRRGYQDSTVRGGLDGMLRGLHENGGIRPGSPVHDILVETLAYPYQQLTPAMRERWVARTIAALERPMRARPAQAADSPDPAPSTIRYGVNPRQASLGREAQRSRAKGGAGREAAHTRLAGDRPPGGGALGRATGGAGRALGARPALAPAPSL